MEGTPRTLMEPMPTQGHSGIRIRQALVDPGRFV